MIRWVTQIFRRQEFPKLKGNLRLSNSGEKLESGCLATRAQTPKGCLFCSEHGDALSAYRHAPANGKHGGLSAKRVVLPTRLSRGAAVFDLTVEHFAESFAARLTHPPKTRAIPPS
jgi:hypothetical protein